MLVENFVGGTGGEPQTPRFTEEWVATEMQEDKPSTAGGSDRADAFLFAAGDGLRLRAVEATLEKRMHGHARDLATMCSQLAALRDHFVAEQARSLHAWGAHV